MANLHSVYAWDGVGVGLAACAAGVAAAGEAGEAATAGDFVAAAAGVACVAGEKIQIFDGAQRSAGFFTERIFGVGQLPPALSGAIVDPFAVVAEVPLDGFAGAAEVGPLERS